MTDRVDERRLSADGLVWIITAVAVVTFWLISTSFRPWDLFDRAGFSSDFYDEQARVLLRGRLAVDPAVPGPEGFVVDGKTYLYYGPFLAIFRIPFALFGDVFVSRLVRISMLIAIAVLCRWSARLARAGGRVVRTGSTHQVHPSDGRWAIGVFTAAVAFSPALFAAGWISVYNETELWAFALAVVTITLLVECAADEFAERRLIVLASLAALATTLTRAPIGFGVAFAVGVCGVVLAVRRRGVGAMSATAIGGGVLSLVAHAAVNFAKFDTLFSVPGDQQRLSLDNPTRAAFFESTGGSFFSSSFLPTTLAQYLRPDAIRFERLLPWVRFGPLAENLGSIDVETITPASSLPSSAPLLLVLALVGVVWIVRRLSLTWGLVVVATLLGAIPTFMIGFVANRYLIDMLPPLAAAGAIGVWSVADVARSRWVLGASVVVLAVLGFWVNASLAIWNLELKSPGFTELRYEVDRAVFGSNAPSVIEITQDDPVPRDGVVGVLADCTGVYIAEQRAWVALERSNGVRRVEGLIDDADERVLAATSAWSLTYRPVGSRDGEVTFEREGGDGFTQSVPENDFPISFSVVADPITNSYAAEVGGMFFFLPGDVLTAGGPFIGTDAPGENPEPTSLCTELTQQQ